MRRPTRWCDKLRARGPDDVRAGGRRGGRRVQGDDVRRDRHPADAVARAGDGADRVAGRTRHERRVEGDDLRRRRRGRREQVGQGHLERAPPVLLT